MRFGIAEPASDGHHVQHPLDTPLMKVKKYAGPAVLKHVEERGSNHPQEFGVTVHRAERRIEVVLEGSLDILIILGRMIRSSASISAVCLG